MCCCTTHAAHTYLGHNRRLPVARERIRRIVHNAAVIVVDAERVRRGGARLLKVVFGACAIIAQIKNNVKNDYNT